MSMVAIFACAQGHEIAHGRFQGNDQAQPHATCKQCIEAMRPEYGEQEAERFGARVPITFVRYEFKKEGNDEWRQQHDRWESRREFAARTQQLADRARQRNPLASRA